MSNLSDRVPIPPKDQMNPQLSAATERTMLEILGRPGQLTRECSSPSGPFLQRIKQSFDIGPFKVSGLDYAVESMRQLFAEVKVAMPAVHDEVRSAGVLCVRHRRTNPARFSNHSWGCSIDIYFGAAVVPQGTRATHRGNLLLAPFFNKYGWYWGAEFSGDSVDSMHFELAEETILKLRSLGAPDAGDL
jgi:D-alanyl-D-alanine carboxypeptidase